MIKDGREKRKRMNTALEFERKDKSDDRQIVINESGSQLYLKNTKAMNDSTLNKI